MGASAATSAMTTPLAMSSNTATTATSPVGPRRRGGARTALVEAAMRLLPERAPSAITGRDLAGEAHVNYGLVHHHFGGKDAVLHAGMTALRDDFVRLHRDQASLELLVGDCHPYLRALVRSQIDYPNAVTPSSDFPIGTALVDAVAPRVIERNGTDSAETTAETKARVIAMISIQLCFGVFGDALLDGTGVGHRERPSVETELRAIYNRLALIEPTGLNQKT